GDARGNTAIVTGVETAGGAADRVLRIWAKDGDRWQIVAGQTTWIGERTDVPDPAGALPVTTPAPFTPASAAEIAIWTSQQALMRSFAEADPDSYRRFSTQPAIPVDPNRHPISREPRLAPIPRR